MFHFKAFAYFNVNGTRSSFGLENYHEISFASSYTSVFPLKSDKWDKSSYITNTFNGFISCI